MNNDGNLPPARPVKKDGDEVKTATRASLPIVDVARPLVLAFAEGGVGAAGSSWGLLANSSNVKPITEALNRGLRDALLLLGRWLRLNSLIFHTAQRNNK